MKKIVIKPLCFVLLCLLLSGVAGCTDDKTNESSDSAVSNESTAEYVSKDASTDAVMAGNENVSEEASEPAKIESTDLTAFYDKAAKLHNEKPTLYRDPGELQPETTEMVKLEDGQWYQSFVYSSYNCRCVFLNNQEYEMQATWNFVPIGSAENAFLYNAGVKYEAPDENEPYTERSIAVRGTLSDGTDGYAYTLMLPDKLIVCVKNEANECSFTETETLLIPKTAATVLDGKKGTVTVTGVVMQDENGALYLKDVALFVK